jgi:hypothetical protein
MIDKHSLSDRSRAESSGGCRTDDSNQKKDELLIEIQLYGLG